MDDPHEKYCRYWAEIQYEVIPFTSLFNVAFFQFNGLEYRKREA